MGSLANIKLIGLYSSIFILFACIGTRSTSGPIDPIELVSLNKRLNQKEEQIKQLEQKLLSYQTTMENHSHVNNEVNQLKNEIDNELITTLDELNSEYLEQDYLNILDKVQKKIQLLENRTFYTDSLYFEIVNDMVLVENKISSLILSIKEMNDLLLDKAIKVVPQITNEEYTAKYIESLSHYQNAEWESSLHGFNYLIQVDSSHDLADNCQYWIGEVYYALNDYSRSIKEFEKVSTYLGTNKSDDAQFKMGLCYINIGQIDQARKEFKNLLEFYPNSEYYKRAQDYLKQN